ncbi:hypothetical protein [Runella salmonicolor]|uniref:Uncharacterized protein n=1 Tax=Runella salmonicolor TaxID=2950278 RepID=A0ABT1FGE9_9BACT|nr:hypothetical protein [Runella salmonicolor]MCP1380827.1 hypothetical protein [Runella salmonicolor]
MNSKELSVKFIEGIDKALKELVPKKAVLGQSFVIADAKGGMKTIPAKQLLKKIQSKKKWH